MRLSTSTNICNRAGEGPSLPVEECLKRCMLAGFRVLDINFCDLTFPGQPLAKPDWESWVQKVKHLAQEGGLVFSQSHAPFYNVCNTNLAHRDFLEEMVRRSIVASGELGVKWIAMHAGTVLEDGYSARRSRDRNLSYFRPHIALAKECGCGIALENMADFKERRRWYTASTEELIDLVDAFEDESVGICWDFGHANLTGADQAESLRQVGSWLKSTHVDDNHGKMDEHLAPFYGNIAWEPLMKILSEIGYLGDFTFEVHEFAGGMPDALRDSQLEHIAAIGNYLLSFA